VTVEVEPRTTLAAALREGAGRLGTRVGCAGCSAELYAQRVRPAGGPLMIAGERFQDVEDVEPIESRLAAHGLTPADVDVVVQTHLDWDHTMNTTKFPGARILSAVSGSRSPPIPCSPPRTPRPTTTRRSRASTSSCSTATPSPSTAYGSW
jgi:hypothetical protein